MSPLRILAELFSGRSCPNICPGIIFLVFFGKFGTFLPKICAHSERYGSLKAGIFEIETFFGNNTDDNGNAMLQNLISKLFKKYSS